MTTPADKPRLAALARPSRVDYATPAQTARRFLRRNLLLIASTTVFAGLLLVLMAQIDTVYFNREKHDLLRTLIENDRLLNDGSRDELVDFVRTFVQQYPPGEVRSPARAFERERALDRGRLLTARLVENNPMIWRVVLRDTAGTVLLEFNDPERIHRQNNWSNSLFFRDFSRSIVNQQRLGTTAVSSLEMLYTTPRGVREVEALTSEWRARAAMVALACFALYGAMLWGVLLPVRSVVRALDKGDAVGAPVIPRPRSLLERYYNNLARDANLSLLSTSLREYVASEAPMEREPLLDLTPRLIAGILGLDGAEVWEARRDAESDALKPERRFGADGELPTTGDFAAVVSNRLVALGQGGLHEYHDDRGSLAPYFIEPVLRDDAGAVVLVVRDVDARGGLATWWGEVFASVARELRFSLESVAQQRRRIMLEKSKANISLSRNLGHDLTNIIATGKLELMTVKALLEMQPDELRASPAKQRIFRESLEALLNNTRFLQETVNLYRSFTYLSRPKFEEVRIDALLADVRTLFALSISRNIRILHEAEAELPPAELEPRLLRLALFNLLNNAAEAIKRGSTTEKPSGEIRLRAAVGRHEGTIEIVVEDNGPGIRNPTGDLMTAEETARIFALGYSTKEADEGEGLGLNWVLQIVRDFHGGQIAASNREEGGAAFHILLPIRHGVTLGLGSSSASAVVSTSPQELQR